jgi:hypothetical protein
MHDTHSMDLSVSVSIAGERRDSNEETRTQLAEEVGVGYSGLPGYHTWIVLIECCLNFIQVHDATLR